MHILDRDARGGSSYGVTERADDPQNVRNLGAAWIVGDPRYLLSYIDMSGSDAGDCIDRFLDGGRTMRTCHSTDTHINPIENCRSHNLTTSQRRPAQKNCRAVRIRCRHTNRRRSSHRDRERSSATSTMKIRVETAATADATRHREQPRPGRCTGRMKLPGISPSLFRCPSPRAASSLLA